MEAIAGCRGRAVRLDERGAPIEASRRDFGRTACRYLVTAAWEDCVLALYDGSAGCHEPRDQETYESLAQ